MKSLPKAYDPQQYEDKIYKMWEKSGYFNPDNLKLPKNAKPYTIVLPPPNITDKLHLGHSMMLAVEDLLIRFHRMQGYRALWIPGTDHAAIATQNVVEKRLLKEKNLTRHQLGKEKFLKEVWNFLKVTQATILKQTRKMGGSLDWSREAFTLDKQRQKAVRQMFVDMYNEGVIYRGKRIVNWCPRCKSTLADDEVEYKEELGKLYWIKYGPFTLATSRPETKLGDTAVAVYPGDKRYSHMIGKKYMIPGVLGEFEITVVADRAVDPKFGSGAIKVTPAHDFTDNEIACRHNLEMRQIIDEDGKMMDNCGKYHGLTTQQAREAIVNDMQKMGLIDHIDEGYKHNLATCYRCGTVIEPIPSDQWFVAVDKKLKRLGNKSLKEKAIEVAAKKKVKFIPFRFTKRYLDWMTNLHDWCISRQIWFGHDIPVWYKKNDKTAKIETYVGTTAPKGKGWSQDPDTLDTWFSSGMWTFSTLGWPDSVKTSSGKPVKTGDLKKFHPTQVLETGYEIITLWVSRMIMMSLFAVGEIPFENVYLHGMVLDKHGKKMSKSKGNGIDPLDMIAKYGTDAVRLSLLLGSTPGNDTRLFEEKIEGYRNFINKLWNISRYIDEKTKSRQLRSLPAVPKQLSLADQWILYRLNFTAAQVTEDIKNYNFSLAGERLKEFTWNDFADWYIEISKIEKDKEPMLLYILNVLLRLWHPFIPFVTEQIYQSIFPSKGDFLMVSQWPTIAKPKATSKANTDFEKVKSAVYALRKLRAAYHIEPAKIIPVKIQADKADQKILKAYAEVISRLARVEISSFDESKKPAKSAAVVLEKIKLYAELGAVIDIAKEKQRLEQELSQALNYLDNLSKKLSNAAFVKNARKEIVEAEREKQKKQKLKVIELKNYIKNLG